MIVGKPFEGEEQFAFEYVYDSKYVQKMDIYFLNNL